MCADAPQGLCASLLALHLLDSLPLSNALDLFLKQRTRALNALSEAIHSNRDKSITSKNSERSTKDEVRFVRESFQSVLDMTISTVRIGREAFGKIDDSPSTIEKVLSYSHNNDELRINTPVPEELCLTTESLINSLPNSNYFASLSSDIRSFKPFVDSDSSVTVISPSALDQKLRAWFTSSLKHLESSTGPWLSRLLSVKEVWEIRTSIEDWLIGNSVLLDVQEINALSRFIEDLCGQRAEDIWKLALRNLLTRFSDHLHTALSNLNQEVSGNDLGMILWNSSSI